ncbi:MAG TPA: vWA domain-containing protein, partial [Acidimicrobiales bacterium]|nr:vWA domain-containing protein [Acidimicrobiales bacterium]
MTALFVVAPPVAWAAAPTSGNGATPTAAGSAHTVRLVEVNSADSNKIQVVYRYDGAAIDATKATFTENGSAVKPDSGPTPVPGGSRPVGVVIVMDTSASTDASGVLAEGRAAIKALLPTLASGTQISVVAAGGSSLLAQRFTTDKTLVTKALDLLSPQGDGALWEGVARAATEIKDQSGMVGSIVLVTDGNSGQGVPFDSAKGAAVDAGATLYGFGLSGKTDEAAQLADATGGAFATSDKATDASKSLTAFAPAINGLYSFTYKSLGSRGVNDLAVSVSDASTKGSFVVGSDARGPSALAFQAASSTSGIKALQNSFGKSLAIVLGLIAAALAAYAIIGIAIKDNSSLASVLLPYSETYGGRIREDDDDEDDVEQGMAQTAVVQRAVELTRQFAESRGFLPRVEGALERANLPLRAAEAMFFYVAAAAIVTLLAIVVTRSPFHVLIVLGIVVLIPPAGLSYMSNRRKRQFEAMLPD